MFSALLSYSTSSDVSAAAPLYMQLTAPPSNDWKGALRLVARSALTTDAGAMAQVSVSFGPSLTAWVALAVAEAAPGTLAETLEVAGAGLVTVVFPAGEDAALPHPASKAAATAPRRTDRFACILVEAMAKTFNSTRLYFR
jgi:hypothetical protein